jgi:tripartite-type tricarboxylate transporter receptor subunit TctC
MRVDCLRIGCWRIHHLRVHDLRRLTFSLVALLAGSFVACTAASAQNWPSRPVKFIVTLAAGGTPDIIARLVADKLGQAIGQQVIVENRAGGANAIGAGVAARAAPDGYTFLFATAAALVTNPHTFKTLPYDALKDFVPVAKVINNPFFVLVNPDVRANNLTDLIALAKAQPGAITIATDGQRNFSGMLAAWMGKLGGVSFNMVPYSAMPQGVQDTLAGRVQVAILAVASSLPHIQSGKLRAIATSSGKRVPGFDQLQPIAETFPGFDFMGWFVLVAPAGTPRDVVLRINKEMDTILKDPDVQARWRELGFYTFADGAGTPESTGDYIKAQYDAWGKVVKEIGLQPE